MWGGLAHGVRGFFASPAAAAASAAEAVSAVTSRSGEAGSTGETTNTSPTAPLSLTLEEAIARVLAEGAERQLADIALEEARLAYEEAKANHMLRPSVVALQQAESAWHTAQRTYELTLQDIVQKTEEGYYDILRSDLALDLAERSLAQAEAQLESTQARYDQGMVSDVDLLAAEMQVADRQIELNRARAAAATARMRFNRALGRPLDAPLELADELAFEPVEVDLEAALASAVARRLELQRARDTVTLRETELRVTDNPYSPRLDIERAKVALRRAQVELAEREADIILEVRQNYQSLLEAADRVPIQRTNLTRAEENLRIAEARYEAGVITAIDLVDARRQAFQAETDLIRATFDYNVALARFLRSAAQSANSIDGIGELSDGPSVPVGPGPLPGS